MTQPDIARRARLQNLFLQNTGTLKIQAPKTTSNLNAIVGYHPSWAGKVKKGRY